jgi:hypothetical protein
VRIKVGNLRLALRHIGLRMVAQYFARSGTLAQTPELLTDVAHVSTYGRLARLGIVG